MLSLGLPVPGLTSSTLAFIRTPAQLHETYPEDRSPVRCPPRISRVHPGARYNRCAGIPCLAARDRVRSVLSAVRRALNVQCVKYACDDNQPAIVIILRFTKKTTHLGFGLLVVQTSANTDRFSEFFNCQFIGKEAFYRVYPW